MTRTRIGHQKVKSASWQRPMYCSCRCNWWHSCRQEQEAEQKQKVEKQKEQQLMEVIFGTVAHDKINEACSIAVIFKNILMLANSVSEVAEKMKDAHERMEERLKVLHVDMQHLWDQFEQHLTKEKKNCPTLMQRGNKPSHDIHGFQLHSARSIG